MKITFVIQDLFSQGAQYATALVARGLSKRGISVDIVVSQVHNELLAEGKRPFDIPEAVSMHILPDKKARNNVGALRRWIKINKPDVVITMSPNYDWCLRLATLFMMHKPMRIMVCHGNVGMTKNQIDYPAKMWTRRWFVDRFLLSGFERVFTVSETSAKNHSRIYPFYPPDRVHCVYNPVVDDVFYTKRSQSPKHPWLVNKTCPTIVSAGAYYPEKAHDVLLEAVRLVNEKRKVRLVLFGRGNEEEKYRTFVAKNKLEDVISIAGYCDCLPAEEKAADLFVLASKHESFSIVLIEALACGIPVVSTDAPLGPREILKDGEYGRLVPVNDSRAMAQAIVETLDAGKQLIPAESWKRFELDHIVDLYLKGCGVQ